VEVSGSFVNMSNAGGMLSGTSNQDTPLLNTSTNAKKRKSIG
jgi:hypothetical protein